jgi:hypothetical protein
VGVLGVCFRFPRPSVLWFLYRVFLLLNILIFYCALYTSRCLTDCAHWLDLLFNVLFISSSIFVEVD